MGKSALLRTLAAPVLLAVIASACSGQDDSSPTAPAQTVEVLARSTKFDPDSIEIPAGRPVTLILNNQDPTAHDLQVVGLEVSILEGGMSGTEQHGGHGTEQGALAVHTSANGSASITFQADAPGEYDFYCTITGHKEAGMKGRLKVT